MSDHTGFHPRLRRPALAAAAVAACAVAVPFAAASGAAAAPAAPAHSGSTSGKVSLVASGLDNPRGLAFDARGHLYVAEAGHGGSLCIGQSPEGGESCAGLSSGISKVESGPEILWARPARASSAGRPAASSSAIRCFKVQ